MNSNNMTQQTYCLVMRAGPEVGRKYALSKSEIHIGRDVSNDIVISDAEVSRKHARLVWQGKYYALEDLGSTNGTLVSGMRITSLHPLKPGDVIQMGEHVTLVYERVQPDPEATVAVEREVSAPPAAVAPSAPEPLPVEAKRERKKWLLAGCGCLLLFACLLVLLVGWYIDVRNLWCVLFPFLPGC